MPYGCGRLCGAASTRLKEYNVQFGQALHTFDLHDGLLDESIMGHIASLITGLEQIAYGTRLVALAIAWFAGLPG